MADDVAGWLAAVRAALVETMSGPHGTWHDDGAGVIGPGTLAIRVERKHDAGPHHVDLGFVLDRTRADTTVLWDCVTGLGEREEAASFACRIWAQTTAPALLELLSQRGDHADHAHGDPSLGLATWHSIHGPLLGYGSDDASPLQRWCLDHPIVPQLGDTLAAALSPGAVHAVKLLVGAIDDRPIAEVRIDGVVDPISSRVLLGLGWPKTGSRIVRSFVLFVHPVP